MSDITIEPFASPFDVSVTPPGSKSLTNRALVLAALADGPCTISNILFADDTLVLPRRRAPQGAPAAKEKAPAAKAAKKKKRKKRKRTRKVQVAVPGHAKMIRTISRMSPTRLKQLRGPAMIWKRRLEKRGKISSLVQE